MDASIKKELENHDIFPRDSQNALFTIITSMHINWNDEVSLSAYRQEVEELRKLYEFLEKVDQIK